MIVISDIVPVVNSETKNVPLNKYNSWFKYLVTLTSKSDINAAKFNVNNVIIIFNLG